MMENEALCGKITGPLPGHWVCCGMDIDGHYDQDDRAKGPQGLFYAGAPKRCNSICPMKMPKPVWPESNASLYASKSPKRETSGCMFFVFEFKTDAAIGSRSPQRA
jgi:hypothetical protein